MTVAAGEKFGTTAVIDGRDAPPPGACGGVVAVGNFDGVHRGHAELLRQARLLAGAVGGPITVVTFDPHPLQLLAPARFLPPLTTTADRARYLLDAGADAVVFLRTTADLLALTPEDFFRTVLREGFDARGIVEGFNFRFGHDRAGSVETLKDLCAAAGIAFRVVEPFALDGVTVSSSKVRNALLAGDVATAAKFLGRPYLIRGTVGTGAKRGRTIGFPTANLEAVETLVPATGVYAVRADVGGRRYPSAANIGPNPTFGEDARKIEAHLIGFEGDLYGRPLALEFVERLRDTRKFRGVEELVGQMRADVAKALALLGGGAMTPAELKARVEHVLRTEVAPALELDGTQIEVLDVTDGVARLRLGNACAGCPATIWTIINGIEQELRRRVPEVEYLEATP